MADITLHRWECDRCHVILDKNPHAKIRGGYMVMLDYQLHGVVAAGPSLRWRELCEDCSNAVYDLMEQVVSAKVRKPK